MQIRVINSVSAVKGINKVHYDGDLFILKLLKHSVAAVLVEILDSGSYWI